MERNWQNTFRSLSRGNALIHPDSPAGASGCGVCRRPPGSVGSSYLWSPAPHPDSPSGRRFNWQELSYLEFEQRFARALEEIECAGNISHLTWLAEPFAVPGSFALAACHGIAETPQGTSRAALELAKLFVLGDLHETRQLYRRRDRIPELETSLGLLKISSAKRSTLIQELDKAIFAQPGSFFNDLAGNLSPDRRSNWEQLKTTMKSEQSYTPAAGRRFGGVLADVLLSLSTMRDAASLSQYRGEIPELVRLSEHVKRFNWKRTEATVPGAAAPPPTSPAQRPAPPPARVASSRPPEPDPDTFVLNADQAAIAAVQQEAARLGVPFCEECEKARLANLAQQAGSQG